MKGIVKKDYPEFNFKKGDIINGSLAIKDQKLGIFIPEFAEFFEIDKIHNFPFSFKNNEVFYKNKNITKNFAIFIHILSSISFKYKFNNKEYELSNLSLEMKNHFDKIIKMAENNTDFEEIEKEINNFIYSIF